MTYPAPPAPPAATPPVPYRPVYGNTGTRPTPQYVWLITAGVVLSILAGVSFAHYESLVSSDTYYDDPSGWLQLAVFLFGFAQFVLIPGLIGWGVTASGILKSLEKLEKR